MLVEDIERTLKDFILFAYPDVASEGERSDLATAIQRIATPPHDFVPFKQAIAKYMKAAVPDAGNLDPKLAKEAFNAFTSRNADTKNFDDLTLKEYIDLFLHSSRWKQFQTAIRLDRAAISEMLNAVRVIRNKLAHFSGEVTETEQEYLRFCLQWLENHQDGIRQAFQPAVPTHQVQEINPADTSQPTANRVPRVPGESRYAPLARFLADMAQDGESPIRLTFADVEKIIGTDLPPYARKHRSWWANDNVSRVQSRQWLGAGWRVKYVDMKNENVVFEIWSHGQTIELPVSHRVNANNVSPQ